MAEPAADGTGVAEKPPVSNLNIANALTVLRIALVPLFAWVLLTQDGQDPTLRVIAFVVFALAMITDRIDGEIARSRGLVTNFGKIADPIADKALTGMAFIGLSVIGEVWWWVTIVVLLREWSVTILRLSVAKDVVIAAARSGKIKTMLQALGLGGVVLPFSSFSGAWEVPGDVLHWFSVAVLAAAVVMTLWSGYEFFRDYRRQRRGSASTRVS